jgi:septal ring factor EnvC (AmiA/AmiB activator)
MTLTPTINGDLIRQTFQAWNAERDSLDSELSESLAALEAYQIHLDTWHQQLAREREELQNERGQFERDRLSADKNQSEASAATISELHAAREKISALTTLLLNRTEELRTLDNRRAEAQTELELARARERELNVALERQLEVPVSELQMAAVEISVPSPPQTTPPPASPASKSPSSGDQPRPRENPLLGSIVEQFGKLRQQRAVERQAQNRQR